MEQNLVYSNANSARDGLVSSAPKSSLKNGGGRQRSSKRGNKNVNQKQVRQKQDVVIQSAHFYPPVVSNSTPNSSRLNNDYTH